MPPPASRTMNDYVRRTDVQDTDDIAGKRGSSSGAESLWYWSVLKAAAAIRTQLNLAGLTVLQPNKDNHDTLGVSRTYTIAGSPANGDVTNLNLVCTAAITVGFPSSRRAGSTGFVTALLVPIGNHELSWKRINGEFWLVDSVGDTTETP